MLLLIMVSRWRERSAVCVCVMVYRVGLFEYCYGEWYGKAGHAEKFCRD